MAEVEFSTEAQEWTTIINKRYGASTGKEFKEALEDLFESKNEVLADLEVDNWDESALMDTLHSDKSSYIDPEMCRIFFKILKLIVLGQYPAQIQRAPYRDEKFTTRDNTQIEVRSNGKIAKKLVSHTGATVYGNITIDTEHNAQTVLIWIFKIMEYNDYIHIGITTLHNSTNAEYHSNTSGITYTCSSDAEMWRNGVGKGRNDQGPFLKGDKMKIVLHLGTKKVKYYKNNQHYHTFNDIETGADIKYKMAVSLYHKDSEIALISFKDKTKGIEGHVDTQKQLELVIMDYETEYTEQNERERKDSNDVTDRVLHTQKKEMIERIMAERIKKIRNKSLIDVVKEYVFDVLNDVILNRYKDDIIGYFEENHIDIGTLSNMKRSDFALNIVNHCSNIDDNECIELKRSLRSVYGAIAQYVDYEKLRAKVRNHETGSCCNCICKYHILQALDVGDRIIYSDKIILKLTKRGKERNEENMNQQIKLNTETEEEEFKLNEQMETFGETLEISRITANIHYTNKTSEVHHGDILYGINEQCIDGMETVDIITCIEYEPLPFQLTFKQHKKCCKCSVCTCCKKKHNSLKKKKKHSVKGIVFNWIIKFMKLSLNIVSKTSSMLDAATDIVLLYKSSQSGTIIFTMILFLTLLSPYILSYSSGVQIFLYRKTFENVELFTFKSLLLGLYLFPTGIWYFILLDIVDALAELYKWFAFGVLNKIKSQNDLVKIESNIAEYFGMSRMDWFSFKKQKLIAQLFFETVPQVTLQVLLFSQVIPGREETGITDTDLILSISSAVFNSFMQLFRLKKESKAAKETFVQYALNCITARYGWVPYNHLIEQFIDDDDVKTLEINYKIQYELPLVTCLSKRFVQRNAVEPLQIVYDPYYSSYELEDIIGVDEEDEVEYNRMIQYTDRKQKKAAYGSIQYDFSGITANKLITTIKGLPLQKLQSKTIKITFGDALRLLNVRSILSLMRACAEKDIDLDDIDAIDWNQPFENTSNADDIRLFSNIFDVDRKSLLISLYLTGYGNKNNYSILKAFVSEYDVPINIPDDKGDTILHHMIRNKDYNGVHEFLNALRPNHRFHFEARNDSGDSIIHLMIQKNNIHIYQELKYLLDKIRLTSNTEFSLKVFNNLGQSVLYLALEQDRKRLKSIRYDIEVKDIQEEKKEESDHENADDIEHIDCNVFLNKIIDIDEKYDVVDDTGSNIQPQTVMHIMNFMMHRMEHDPKKYNEPISIDDPKYIEMKQWIEQNKEEKQKIDKKTQSMLNAIGKKPQLYMLHQLLIEFNAELVDSKVHRESERTALGHILHPKYVEDIGLHLDVIVDDLLNANARVFATESSLLCTLFVYIFENKIKESRFYLNILHKIINQCNVSILDICDNNKNNPLHSIIRIQKEHKDSGNNQDEKEEKEELPFPSVILYLCKTYPEWMMMQNKNHDIPLYLVISNKNINTFYCLVRYMTEHRMDVKMYLKQRNYVQKMVDFGSELLEQENIATMKLLLSTFDYPEIFRFASDPNTFDAAFTSKDISLIKNVSQKSYKNKIDEILFDQCFVNKDYNCECALMESEVKVMKENANADIDADTYDEIKEEEKEEDDDDEEEEEDDESEDEKLYQINKTENESIDWIELVYSTIVETFSALDLYTDILIMMQLYESDNQWWSTWMLLLLTSPYLVSHGSLVVILQKKLSFNNVQRGCCLSFIISFLESLLMTPMALFYLFMIDVIFMIFSLISTFWLLLVILMATICCKGAQCAAKYDIREWVDKKVFEDFLRMNRTEIVGYRRLRTLSQLFFETIPQILLQLRILWVIEWSGDNNTFEIDLETLGWSIGLAVAHLILEGGIIYFDKTAFKMSFMEYSLECLGGRTQWIPFQHLFHNTIPNQLYIYRDNDRKKYNKERFIAKHYNIVINHENDDEEHKERQSLLSFDYEDISANMQCIKYCASFQFSSQSMDVLTQILINCPEIVIPTEFKISTNIVLENLMKNILCRTEIKFGSYSFGTVDMLSFCDLYRASLNKVNIDIASISDETVHRLRYNVENDSRKTKKIDDKIMRIFVNSGEIKAMKWLKSDTVDIWDIKRNILNKCISSGSNGNIRLDILRRCYINQFYVASNCQNMQKLNLMIEECLEKSKQDSSWYFVIIFILLYSKGSVFGAHCSNKQCVMNESLKNILHKHYIPTYIELNGIKIPFQLFESCHYFRDLYRKYIEEIFINKCKNYMISLHKMDNKRPIQKVTNIDLRKQFRRWQIFEEIQNKEDIKIGIEKLLYQLYKNEIKSWNVVFLDKLIFEAKMYTGYHQYLHETLKYRTLQDHKLDPIHMEQLPNAITSDNVKIYRSSHDLIPEFEIEERFQIYELKISFVIKNKQNPKYLPFDVSFVPTISVHEDTDNISSSPEDVYYKHNVDLSRTYLWHSQWEETQRRNVTINESNVALSYYNYHLLHCESQDRIPMLRFSYFLNPNEEKGDPYPIDIIVQYTTLYKNEAEMKQEAQQEEKKENVDFPSEAKIVMLGTGGVGKSSLTIRLITGEFVGDYDPTIEDSYRKQVTIDGSRCLLDVLDTAGQEEFSSIQDQWMREGQVFVIVYSITSRASFNEAKTIREKVLRINDDAETPIVLVGNKCDLEDQRLVRRNEGAQMASGWGKHCAFFETSAKDGINHEICFYEGVRLLHKQMQQNPAAYQEHLRLQEQEK